jgi:hypothetical protein
MSKRAPLQPRVARPIAEPARAAAHAAPRAEVPRSFNDLERAARAGHRLADVPVSRSEEGRRLQEGAQAKLDAPAGHGSSDGWVHAGESAEQLHRGAPPSRGNATASAAPIQRVILNGKHPAFQWPIKSLQEVPGYETLSAEQRVRLEAMHNEKGVFYTVDQVRAQLGLDLPKVSGSSAHDEKHEDGQGPDTKSEHKHQDDALPDVGGTPEERWDFRGSDKWKEFIDEKDHPKGMFAYDDWRPPTVENPHGTKTNNDNPKALYDFLHADQMVRASLGAPMTVRDYEAINKTATAGMRAPGRIRTGGVQWRMADVPTDEEKETLSSNRYLNHDPNAEDGRLVEVPALDGKAGEDHQEAVRAEAAKIFAEHDDAMKEAGDTDAKIAIIAKTYQQLESLHAFNDGTSRTNHLVLNKMLTEIGQRPISIRAPNAPSTPLPQLIKYLKSQVTAASREEPGEASTLARQRRFLAGTKAMGGTYPARGVFEQISAPRAPSRPAATAAEHAGSTGTGPTSTSSRRDDFVDLT